MIFVNAGALIDCEGLEPPLVAINKVWMRNTKQVQHRGWWVVQMQTILRRPGTKAGPPSNSHKMAKRLK